MLHISYYKHLLKILYNSYKKNYSSALHSYIRMIMHNMKPTKKIINYDNWLEKIINNMLVDKKIDIEYTNVSDYSPKILIFNTEIYDTGGHTELAYRYITDNQTIPIYFYQTNALKRPMELFEKLKKGALIKNIVEDYYISDTNVPTDDKVLEAFNYIINNKITAIMVNIHMQDAAGSAVLYLVKKYTNIEIIFWNHGDHWFSLGTKYADVIYTRIKNGKALTPYLQDNPKCKYGKFIINYNKDSIIQRDEIENIRKSLNIPTDAFLTMTGCVLSKLKKPYFELINEMLAKNNNIYHLFICPNYPKKEKEIKKLFKNNKRVILMSGTSEFDKYIQVSDLYVDSFPQGSALTLVDCIKYKRPVVIKINKKEPIRSFEEYLYPNYEYAFEMPKNMLDGILELANNRERYEEMSEKVWEYFKKEYLS